MPTVRNRRQNCYTGMSIVVSIKIHMTGINGCSGILMDSSVHRQNGYAGVSVLGINRECSSTGMPKSVMKRVV